MAGGTALLVLMAVPTPGLAPAVAQSSDNSRYASIVVDAASGEVLFGRFADSRRYPASITKVMTLYLAFDALQQGKVKLDDVIVVSPRAASQPPSKLGLAAGQRITLDDAMRATAVRSANDMAVAIAEHVGGSEARFAAMATLKAQELGMTQTRYVNPNGLPDTRQTTSARDLTILARAVMRDFPQYYSYFGLHDWAYQGRDYRNTNGLLLSGQGYDGIKTGYINASGYNLAASAVRDGKRVITVVMGGRSSASRNAHVAELMNTGFEVQRRRSQGEPIQVAQTFFEQRGFGIGNSALDPSPALEYASINGGEDQGAEMDTSGNEISYTSLDTPTRLAAATVTPPPAAATPAPVPPVAVASQPAPRSADRAIAPSPRSAPRAPVSLTASLNGASGTVVGASSAAIAPPRASIPPAGSGWSVQVGAFREASVAQDWLTEVNRRFRAQFSTARQTVDTASGWHRSRFTGLTEAAAQEACSALSERRVTCLVIRPGR
ncbi:serine hydrolase [Brevundimonas variabilis]|uniref:D-alanyl-D-alanine carboxypeptidase (Penicillin-binding protein 5/6) n=1 Tax=Brevundimonas variabilis TaxID=74312 RepID=A0A7W9CHZ5_9CAUL|nr:serine hydrolase [Brevundimonas variabilis]MBB5746019.1 D-alanyl-D-alanine carboxypeptidase (penicillin-binding protein 5/6) [Brevundimonas variabilis]